jgi:hypothetical protein
VRWCANNTGNEPDDQLWGEAICLSDGTLAQAGSGRHFYVSVQHNITGAGVILDLTGWS